MSPISSKEELRQTTRRSQRQSEVSRAPGFDETTTSWQFHRLSQGKLELVRERPFRFVWHGVRFDHALRSFLINNEKRCARQVTQIIDDDFLLLWIIKVKTAHQDAID